MTTTRVVMLSLWRNDERHNLVFRCRHLLAKTYPNLRYAWVVGDSADRTWAILDAEAKRSGREVQIINIVTGLADRFERLSESANIGLSLVREDDERVVIHESDIISPPDIVERLLATGKCPVAAWPTLSMPKHGKLFYDIWGYHRGEQPFANYPPYHPDYKADELVEVDGVGTCWMFHAEDVYGPHGARMTRAATRDLCRGLKARGRSIWVDPTLEVVQPLDLWTLHDTDEAPL